MRIISCESISSILDLVILAIRAAGCKAIEATGRTRALSPNSSTTPPIGNQSNVYANIKINIKANQNTGVLTPIIEIILAIKSPTLP